MGMPSINIIFRELAKTFEQRNDNGIVALVLANNSGMNPKAVSYTHLALEGRIQTGSYIKTDGTKVYTTEIVAENMEFAERKER